MGGNSEGGRRKGIKISDLTSVTEVVHVLFHTDDSVTRSGWRLEWSSAPSEAEQPTWGIQTGLTLSRKSKFLRATPSGFASLTLIVNQELITSLSEIMMALYSEDTMLILKLMLNSILMEVSHKGVGGLNGEWSMMGACQRVGA